VSWTSGGAGAGVASRSAGSSSRLTRRATGGWRWSTTRGRRSEARTLRIGPELEKFTREVDNYRVFLELTRELVEVNEKICELRPIKQVEDEEELEAMKKKLQRRFARKRSKK
jgi:hypothetical protein